MKCTVCEKEFESKRSDAKFCSNSCRLKSSRSIKKGEPLVKFEEPVRVEEPTKEIKYTKDLSLEDQILAVQKEADLMTTREYLNRGYFGGKAVFKNGNLVERKYFPFQDVRDKFVLVVAKDWGLNVKELKDRLQDYPDKKLPKEIRVGAGV